MSSRPRGRNEKIPFAHCMRMQQPQIRPKLHQELCQSRIINYYTIVPSFDFVFDTDIAVFDGVFHVWYVSEFYAYCQTILLENSNSAITPAKPTEKWI